MRARRHVAGVVVVVVVSTLPFAPATRTQATDRTVVVIGDLHMGDGADVTEDFRDHDGLARLLDALRAQPGGDAVDLVIPGANWLHVLAGGTCTSEPPTGTA